jgi:hypothetical protein
MLRFSDSRNFGRTLAGICLMVGPLLLVVAALLDTTSGDNEAEFLADIAKDDAMYLASGFFALAGGLVLIPGLIGLLRLLRGRRVGAGQIGAGLLLLGTIAAIAFFPVTVYEYEMVQEGADRAQMVGLEERASESAGAAIIFVMFALGVMIGSVIVAVVSWRRGLLPVWAAVALAIAPFVGFVSESNVLGAIAFVLLGIGLGMLGLRMLSIGDDEWERWEPLPERPRAGTPPGAPPRTETRLP